jgi:hypothetical protein
MWRDSGVTLTCHGTGEKNAGVSEAAMLAEVISQHLEVMSKGA